ncbi:CPBP family intramembrane glutamic endopeptidase [Chitinophaga vietnamensis]|uniref:CPBP family intramembrane glutamic endopeptidase n=1 Tax=Chitinophaga vietnamensis TaxID=2593957 RepID=UPI0011789FF4|nr:CPBP family intramembrane glutamic endopeptidase [Chitinophaga vietnamensis]
MHTDSIFDNDPVLDATFRPRPQPFPKLWQAFALVPVLIAVQLFFWFLLPVLYRYVQPYLAPFWMVVITITCVNIANLLIVYYWLKRKAEPGYRPNFRYPGLAVTVTVIVIAMLLTVVPAAYLRMLHINMPSNRLLNIFMDRPAMFLLASFLFLVMEEMWMRGVLVDGLLKNTRPVVALFCAAVVISVIYLSFPMFLWVFPQVLFNNWVYYKTKSLLPTLLGRFGGAVVLLDIFTRTNGNSYCYIDSLFYDSQLYYYTIVAMTLLLIAGLVFLRGYFSRHPSLLHDK